MDLGFLDLNSSSAILAVQAWTSFLTSKLQLLYPLNGDHEKTTLRKLGEINELISVKYLAPNLVQ